MQLPAHPSGIPFHDLSTAQARLENLQTRVSAQFLAVFLPLLADSPDPDWVLNRLERWLTTHPEFAQTFERHPQFVHYAVAVFGHSRYLGGTLFQNEDLLPTFLRPDCLQRSRTREEFHEAWARFSSRSQLANDGSLFLARFKRREYVRILLRDLLKFATLGEITEEISALSDTLIAEALQEATSKLNKKYGPAQHVDRDGRTVETPFAVLALGKLGGNELNYSSDVDLLYVYGEEQAPPNAVISNREYFVRLGQEITRILSCVTGEGPVFRIDMRLRPQGSEGELALSRRQMLAYYTEAAQDWELQALIKIRFAAGDEALARECIHGIQQFVYRGDFESEAPDAVELRFSAIETALQARERILAKLRSGPPVSHTLDVKLDRGGIRDIEFLAQCLQRVHGGREPWLRSRGTLFALQKLHDKDHISSRDFQQLTASYEFFRQVEHRLQLRMGQQTHRLPSLPDEIRILERSLAEHPALQHSSRTLEEALREHMAAVSEIYRCIIHHQQWRLQEETAVTGFALSPTREPASDLPYDVMLDRLSQDAPRLFAAAQATEPGSLGRRNLQRFLGSIFTSSTRYAILLRHPEALTSAIRLFETGGYLTDVLVQYPEECVTLADLANQPLPAASGFLFSTAPQWGSPTSDPVFQFVASSNSSQSEKLALLRRHHRHLSFVTGVRDLTEFRPVYQSFAAHSSAADDAICAAFALARPPDGLAVLALGRLGAREFDVFSDADLIFARDESVPVKTAQTASEQIVHALAAYTREGMLFPVDARLRPHGGEGELVLTPTAFASYCQNEAQAWEALSYSKLRYICGSSEVAARVKDAAGEASAHVASSPDFATSLHQMRLRIENFTHEVSWKSSPGGIYDIDFLTGFLLLKSAISKTDGSLRDRIWRLSDAGCLSKSEASDLDHAAELLRTAEHVSKLVTGRNQKWLPSAPHMLETCERWASGILRRSFHQGFSSALQQTMQAVREIYTLRLR